MHTAYLLIGSNLGDKITHLQQAASFLGRLGAIQKASSIYETEPWGEQNQPWYLNQALAVSTTLSPEQLLKEINDFEKKTGKIKKSRWGARNIDIDILLYDDKIINSQDLIIPHPQLHKRNFTLAPLSEIAPGLEHPVLKKTIKELAANCTDTLSVVKLNSAENEV